MKTLGKALIGLPRYIGTSPYTAAIKEIAQTIAGAWTFTSQILVSLAGATAMILRRNEDGATAGPQFLLDRNSATPGANDFLGLFGATGRDSLGGTVTYGYTVYQIADATNGSIDGRMYQQLPIAGVDTTIAKYGPGVVLGTATGGDKGIGTLNAQGLYVNNAAVLTSDSNGVLQTVSTSTATYSNSANTIPYDNSKPQQGGSEGVEILSRAITPLSASSSLLIKGSIPLGVNTQTGVIVAVFQDATADAIYATSVFPVGGSAMTNVGFEFLVASGSTAARTYKVRVGAVTGSIYINGDNASRLLGGVSAAWLVIQEVV